MKDICSLRALVGEAAFQSNPSEVAKDPRGRVADSGGVLISPATTSEVSRIISYAADHKIGVIPQGGSTGLVLGQLLPEGPKPILLSLHRMASIRFFSIEENIAIVEAGMTLDIFREEALKAGRRFPLALASSASARLGGLYATNAGGINVLRHGMARDLALGVEAVLPDGSVFHGLSRLRKDNSGYDFRHLLIGSEGSLGVITALSLKLFPLPKAKKTLLISVRSPSNALNLLRKMEEAFGQEALEAFELIHEQSWEFLRETDLLQTDQLGPPFPEWSVLVELGGGETLFGETFLEALMGFADAGLCRENIFLARNEAQSQMLWQLRENIPAANRRIGAVVSHDVSLPLTEIDPFIREMPEKIHKIAPLRINCFGHLGDGNLHYNLFPPTGQNAKVFKPLYTELQRLVHDEVISRGGSISAEHGIGRLKAHELMRYADPGKIAVMKAIKKALDPDGIMNPGVILPL